MKPTSQVKACSDPDDDIFLECLEGAEADYLGYPAVVGVRKLIELKTTLVPLSECAGGLPENLPAVSYPFARKSVPASTV